MAGSHQEWIFFQQLTWNLTLKGSQPHGFHLLRLGFFFCSQPFHERRRAMFFLGVLVWTIPPPPERLKTGVPKDMYSSLKKQHHIGSTIWRNSHFVGCPFGFGKREAEGKPRFGGVQVKLNCGVFPPPHPTPPHPTPAPTRQFPRPFPPACLSGRVLCRNIPICGSKPMSNIRSACQADDAARKPPLQPTREEKKEKKKKNGEQKNKKKKKKRSNPNPNPNPPPKPKKTRTRTGAVDVRVSPSVQKGHRASKKTQPRLVCWLKENNHEGRWKNRGAPKQQKCWKKGQMKAR